MKTIAIIGGGIAGLMTAFYLTKYAPDRVGYTVIESASRPGGKVVSAHEDGFVVEGGPDSFLAQKTLMLDLCHTLGLDDQLIGSNSVEHATYVWSQGRLHPMPAGMMLMAPTMILPFLRSGLMSWRGKLRVGIEPFISKRLNDEDESLASFVRRRLGGELLDKIAAPLMAGIHAADPERLSLQSTFPRFSEMEKAYGSLAWGMIKKARTQEKSGSQHKPAPVFMTLRGGLQQLSDAVISELHPKALRLNCCVESVEIYAGQYRLALSDGSYILADDIVFATPAYVTAELIRQVDSALASKLEAIRYVSTATVSLGFKNSEIEAPPDGFGFVVPHSENRKITACTWSSLKFNHRAPEGYALIRVFIGGARAEALAEQGEAALVHLARQELCAIMGITATPVLAKVYRWYKATPQYDVGHQARISEIDKIVAGHRGLYLAGSPYHGTGVPDCIQSADKIAQSITGRIQVRPRREPDDRASDGVEMRRGGRLVYRGT